MWQYINYVRASFGNNNLSADYTMRNVFQIPLIYFQTSYINGRRQFSRPPEAAWRNRKWSGQKLIPFSAIQLRHTRRLHWRYRLVKMAAVPVADNRGDIFRRPAEAKIRGHDLSKYLKYLSGRGLMSFRQVKRGPSAFNVVAFCHMWRSRQEKTRRRFICGNVNFRRLFTGPVKLLSFLRIF